MRIATVYISLLIMLLFSCNQPVKTKLPSSGKDSIVLVQQPKIRDSIFLNIKEPFEITGISNSFANSSDDDTVRCKDWILKEAAVKIIIANGKPIDGPTWHHSFDVLACSKTVKVVQQQKEYRIEINAGSYFTLSNKDSTILFGDYNKTDEKYFLAHPY